MKRHWAAGLAVALWACATPTVADDLDRAAQDLLVRSGLDKQLEAYPDLVRLGVQQARSQPRQQRQLSDEQIQIVIDSTIKAFDPEAMKRIVVARFKSDLGRADIDAALAWLSSPLGRRITQAEEEASTAEAYAELQAWVGTLQANPPAPARVERIRRLDKAARVTDFAMTSMLNSQLAIVSALTAALPVANQRKAFDAVTSAFEQRRPQLRQGAEQQTLVSLLYAYRELPDADFDRYLVFMESDAGRKYQDVAIKGLDEAIVTACRNAGKVFGEALRQHQAPT